VILYKPEVKDSIRAKSDSMQRVSELGQSSKKWVKVMLLTNARAARILGGCCGDGLH